jgi:hypothetical protein
MIPYPLLIYLRVSRIFTSLLHPSTYRKSSTISSFFLSILKNESHLKSAHPSLYYCFFSRSCIILLFLGTNSLANVLTMSMHSFFSLAVFCEGAILSTFKCRPTSRKTTLQESIETKKSLKELYVQAGPCPTNSYTYVI